MHPGEYGELLVEGAGGPLLSREYPTVTCSTSAEVVALLERVLQRPQPPPVAREFVLTALVKLSARFPEQNAHIQACSCLNLPLVKMGLNLRLCSAIILCFSCCPSAVLAAIQRHE